MPIPYKGDVSSALVNSIFLDKTQNDETIGVLGLKDTVTPASGNIIDNAQRYINELGDADGVAGEGDATRKVYSSHEIITSGDDRKVAIGKLDAQVKTNLDNITVIENDYGASDGLATLDSGGKVPLTQLPNDLLIYKGTWDASTNTPTLDDTDTSVDNFWYRCNVAGSVDFGAGSITFAVGDKVVSNGTTWEKWDTTDEVTSVFSRTGAVTAQTGDYTPTQVGLGNVTDDAQLKRAANDINTFTEKVVPIADDILIMEDSADSFNKKKVKLTNLIGGGSTIPSIVNTTVPYTALITDNTITCDGSGGAFTITLYTAVGNTGRILEIKKSDDDYTNPITIDGGALTTTLNTENEKLRLQSNGANWVVLNRDIPAYSETYTPTWTATTNASATGIWRRDRNFMVIDFLGTFTGVNTQNVNLQFTIPTGVTIDTTEITNAGAGTGMDSVVTYQDFGSGTFSGHATFVSTTTIQPRFFKTFGTAILHSGFNPQSSTPVAPANNDNLRVIVRIPITGWNK